MLRIFLLLTIFLSLILHSCSPSGSSSDNTTEISSDSTKVDAETTAEAMENWADDPSDTMSIYGIDGLIKVLPEVDLPYAWDEAFMDNYQTEAAAEIDFNSFDQWGWFYDEVEYYGEEPVMFHWKQSHGNYTLLCFSTFEMFAKGGNTEYYLATLSEDPEETHGFFLIDLINVAASRSISTENPQGGTSAGVEFQYGSFIEEDLKITSVLNGDTSVYFLVDGGEFLKNR